MNRTALAIGFSLAAGFAAAAIVFNASRPGDEPGPRPVIDADPATYFDQSANTEDRLRALESAVAEERNARLLLEDELLALYAEIEALGGIGAVREDMPAVEETVRQEQFRSMRGDRGVVSAEDRIAQLVDAGFSPDRAEWIVRRESELQMDMMQALYDARRNGTRPDRSLMDPGATLRQELGDAQYGQYLEASGLPTSVAVGAVLEHSPGQRAGLQPGDEIVAYGGERVFNFSDLQNATMATESGRSVVVDIVRDGVPMQVVIESGPIGISNRGWTLPIRR